MSLIANINVGEMYMSRGRFDEARLRFQKTLEIDPNFALGNHHMGIVTWLGGDLTGAAKWFNATLVLDPESTFLKGNLGMFFLELGDLRLAEKWIGDNKQALYVATGRYDEAFALAKADLEEHPDKPGNLIGLARTAALVGDTKLARATYEKARALPDQKTDPLMNYEDAAFLGAVPAVELALLMREAGESKAAEAFLEEIWAGLGAYRTEQEKEAHTNAHPYSGIDHMEASILAAMGRDQEALAAMRRAVDNGWRRLWFTERYPSFDNIRDTDEFRALMDEIRVHIDNARAQSMDFESRVAPSTPVAPAAPARSTAKLAPT